MSQGGCKRTQGLALTPKRLQPERSAHPVCTLRGQGGQKGEKGTIRTLREFPEPRRASTLQTRARFWDWTEEKPVSQAQSSPSSVYTTPKGFHVQRSLPAPGAGLQIVNQ